MGDVKQQIPDETVNTNGALIIQGYQPAVASFASITATGAQTSTSANGYNVTTLTLRTFTGTTPSITFKLQASDDNTNWVDLQGINNNTGQVGVSWTQGAALSAGTAGPSIDYTIGAYTNIRINVTAISGASATAAFGLALQTMPYEASPGAVAQGPAAAGSATVGNPVYVAGTDGTNARGIKTDSSGQAIVLPGNTANSTPWLVTDTAATSGGLSIVTGSVGATATAIKASAGQLYGYHLFNTTAAVAYVQIFNTAAASVTLGTTAPIISIGIPASGGVTANFDKGLAFATAISFGCTTTRTGSTGATVDCNFFYK